MSGKAKTPSKEKPKNYKEPKAIDVINEVKGLSPKQLNNDLKTWCDRAKEREYNSEKISILLAIHEHLTSDEEPLWTALPLVRLSILFNEMGYTWLSKSYAMLALCCEARTGGGSVGEGHDSYELSLGLHAMAEREVQAYAKKASEISSELDDFLKPFPEVVLLKLDQNWKTGIPSTAEYGLCFMNGRLIRVLLDKIEEIRQQLVKNKEKDSEKSDNEQGRPRKKKSKAVADPSTKLQGDLLELLGKYLMSCMPGSRINQDPVWQDRTGTDYDVICSLDGFQVDFRTEFGRYFICECKAWNSAADFDVVAKFGRVLDSVRAKFGIIFSLNGLTGEKDTKNAAAEQLNIYRDRGIVMISVNKEDLTMVADGWNFINLIRQKYDDIRLFKRIE